MDVSGLVVHGVSDISVGTAIFGGSLSACHIIDLLLVSRKFASSLI
jgi:hypothetical protein